MAALVAVAGTLTLGGAVVPVAAVAAANPVVDAHRATWPALPGHWLAIGSDGVNTIHNDVHFYPSHTLGIDFAGRIYQGTGLWNEDGRGLITFYQQHPDYDAAGRLVGWTRADIVGRQTGPDTISGAGPVRSYDTSGRLVLALQVTFDATRQAD
jgi:hypothetical protein